MVTRRSGVVVAAEVRQLASHLDELTRIVGIDDRLFTLFDQLTRGLSRRSG
jgi:hypothetical protein